MHKPINFSLPGVGVLALLGKSYETLTDLFIQEWLQSLYYEYGVEPDYLLVSQTERNELHRILVHDFYMWNRYEISRDGIEGYPNRITGHPLTLVVFPGLPEKTIFLGSLLELASEEKRIQGSTTVVTRTFDIMTPR